MGPRWPWIIVIILFVVLVFVIFVQGGENGVVVRQVQDTGHVPQEAPLSKTSGKDHVRWSNETGTARTLIFADGWPFLEEKTGVEVVDGVERVRITIPPNTRSAWYTLNPAVTAPSYRYTCEPSLREVTRPGPPDEPTIGAGD
jgi:hypothetical protein